MELFLATNNPHKKKEFDAILFPHTLLLPRDAGIDFSFEETGKTYFENAYGKAFHLFRQLKNQGVKLPVLADDSGLSVNALDGAPGIYSSRYGADPAEQEKLPADERNRYLLRKLENIRDRRAFFVCSLVVVVSDHRFYSVQETLEGEITEAPRGSGGFGYDPVFYLPRYGKTVAELPETTKNALSHRGTAGKVMLKTIEGASI
jgi:XTP/dITP diphosphohydrolase